MGESACVRERISLLLSLSVSVSLDPRPAAPKQMWRCEQSDERSFSKIASLLSNIVFVTCEKFGSHAAGHSSESQNR